MSFGGISRSPKKFGPKIKGYETTARENAEVRSQPRKHGPRKEARA